MRSYTLYNPQQAYQTIADAWIWAKAQLTAGQRLTLEIKPEKRSDKENRLLHALIGEIAEQKEWAGKKRDAEIWKRLLVASWCRVKGESVEILPALDGHGVDIVPARTSKLTKGECADLIEFIYAWGSETGVQFRDVAQIDSETGEILSAA